MEENALVRIGRESRVAPGCTFSGRVTIGLRNQLNERSLFRSTTIANDVLVHNDSTILGSLGDFVRIGEFSMVLKGADAATRSEIGNFSILGERSTLAPKIKIGNNSCVAAGFFVSKNVGDSVIMNNWGDIQEVPPNKYVKYFNGRCFITGKQIELV